MMIMSIRGLSWLIGLSFALFAVVKCDLFDALKCTGSDCGKPKQQQNESASEQTLNLAYREYSSVPTTKLKEHANTLEILSLADNRITKIKLGDFPYMPKLHTLMLRKNMIDEVEDGSFDFLPSLMVLRIEDNLLRKIPGINLPMKLYELDISFNQVEKVAQSDLKSLTLLETLILRNNKIEVLNDNVFKYNKKMKEIDLSENPLTLMESDSLKGPDNLRFLFLQNTHISKLPEKGIEHLHRLKITGIEELWSVPEPSVFQALKEVDVTYSVHCCPFRGLHTAETKPDNVIPCSEYLARQSTQKPTQKADATEMSKRDLSKVANQTGLMKKKPNSLPLRFSFGDDPDDPFKDILKSFKKTNTTSRPLCSETNTTIKYIPPVRRVKCRPRPDAFNPCDDVIGTTFLRVFSWASCLLAIFGNLFLLLVLYSNNSPLSVYKLLMYHLGAANAIMGFYLAILCCLDAVTFGRYYNYVRIWQYSGGCRVAGFLAVFSTELSVCVLAIVTLERYLLIVHALHIRRQMKLVHAKIALTIAWTYSFVVAVLPVTNAISSYEKVAICLPFETSTTVSKGYVVWLLLYYLLTFIYIIVSYAKMYFSVNGAPSCTGVNTEFKVAKRFSMIVFCNFACWIPISIAGFMSLYSGVPLSIDISKFLLVFAFPLNACTNPFLYAFFTKIFKGDVLNFLSKFGLFKESTRKYNCRSTYVRGRYGSRASDGNVSTSGVSRFSPPGTLKSMINFSRKSPSHAFQNVSNSPSNAPKNGNKVPASVYRSISIETTDANAGNPPGAAAPKPRNATEKRTTGLQTVLDGLWALTTGRRSRNESTSSSKELLSSFDPDRFARIRSVSEAVEITCHDEQSEEIYDIDKMSPDTNVTNL